MFLLRWSCLLSTYMGESSLLVEDEVDTHTLFLKTGGALPMFLLGANSLQSSKDSGEDFPKGKGAL